MSNSLKDAVIVASRRTAVGRAIKGSLATTRPDELAMQVIKGTLADLPKLPPEDIDDVILGCAMPEAAQGMNVARIVALGAGLPDASSAMTMNRFCSSGVQTIAYAAERIQLGVLECALAGGLESMTAVPMGGYRTSLHPGIVDTRPEIYISMGLTAENVAKQFEVSRADQDAFAAESHRRAAAAIKAGHFKDEIVPVTTTEGRTFEVDELLREGTTTEVLAKLPAVFMAKGTVTAGNSSPLSDGAAATVVMSADRAKALGLEPLARFVGFATAGVAPEIMGIGPIEAIPKVLKQTGLKLSDIDRIELNEAFAAQSVAIIKHLSIDPEKVNVNGGAIALGHPLGATGAKLTATLLAELRRSGGRYGMVTMCIGGGMGAAAIFERL